MEVDEAPGRPPPDRFALTTTHALALIVLAGALLRFIPIWFGLPFGEARPDEETAIGHALAILGGDPNPHFFDWPSLTFYLLAACFWLARLLQSLLDVHAVLTANQYFLIARAIVAAAGTITIVILFRLTRRIAGDGAALAAAFFLAVATLHVRDSHFAMTDVLMTLLAMASLERLLEAFDTAIVPGSGRARVLRGFALSGILAGLAASTKYSAAALGASMLAAQALIALRGDTDGRRWLMWMPAAVFGVAFAVCFVAATPYAVLDYRAFAAGVSFDFTHLSGGHGIDVGPGWAYHLTRSLPAGIGVPVCIAAIAGIVVLVRRHVDAALILGAFALTLFGAMASGYTVFFRYVMPLVPVVCLAAAMAVCLAAELIAARLRPALRPAVTVVLALALGLPSLVNSTRLDAALAKTDSRVVAGRWLTEHVLADDSLYDAGGTYAGAVLTDVRGHVWAVGAFDPASRSFKDAGGRIPDWLVLPRSPLIYTTMPEELWQLARDRYEVATMVTASSGPDPGIYDPQDAFFLPISRFDAILRPGPTLAIYRRRPDR